jgi:putative salt-induced outer membrane protein YdiY
MESKRLFGRGNRSDNERQEDDRIQAGCGAEAALVDRMFALGDFADITSSAHAMSAKYRRQTSVGGVGCRFMSTRPETIQPPT